jgi:hypothetical protein
MIIPPGPLRDSVFLQIDPTHFLTKFKLAERMKFPFMCLLSNKPLHTTIINKGCEDVCYFSAYELITKLDNQITPY